MVCLTTIGFYAFAAAGMYFLYKYIQSLLLQRKLERWNHTPKDLVILHAFPKGQTLPSGSPFVLKIQTYLRMANIKHQEVNDYDFMGPKGKCPWISINGQHISDTEFIIKYLNKKFEKKFDDKYSEEQLALAASVRIMLEEHAFWGLALDRFVFTKSLHKISKAPLPVRLYAGTVVKYNIRKQTYNHGMGRHTEAEIVELVSNDFRIVSKILGSKKFILGNEPCLDDCAIFGMLAQCVWGLPGSPYEKLVNGELSILKEYCLRMKERFFPDWEQCLHK